MTLAPAMNGPRSNPSSWMMSSVASVQTTTRVRLTSTPANVAARSSARAPVGNGDRLTRPVIDRRMMRAAIRVATKDMITINAILRTWPNRKSAVLMVKSLAPSFFSSWARYESVASMRQLCSPAEPHVTAR